MTYNRMAAKPIAGEHCRFCGDAKAALVKTPCCAQWICCDTAFMSFRGGGRCQVEHERFSLCYSHYEDQHRGPWESCQKCRDFWSLSATAWKCTKTGKMKTWHFSGTKFAAGLA
jgi:hypothetical protein